MKNDHIDATTGEVSTVSSPESALEIFVAFSQMALSGFGGVMPIAYRHIVEKRKWHTPTEFAEMLAMGQVLPGPTICNVSVMIGWRKAGPAGAIAALAGMIAGPSLIVVALAIAYGTWGQLDVVRRALAGMSLAATGLVLATATKMAIALFKGKSGQRLAVLAALAMAAFAGVGVLRWPLIAVVVGLAPLAIAYAWREDR